VSQAASSVVVDKNVAVPMRDGAVLRADVYRPAGTGRHPVLMQRTPYNKEFLTLTAMTLDPIRAAQAGYAVAIQDVRGRWASDGPPFFFYRDEPDDCYDTAQWAAAQPWSDGAVGAYGLSYMGATTWMTAAGAPPALRAISPTTAPSDFWNNHLWRGGALHWGLLVRWALSTVGPSALLRALGATPDFKTALSGLADSIDGYEREIRRLPLTDFPAALPDHPEFLPFFFEALRHPTRDAWASSLLVAERHGRVRVPALIIAGWHDLLLAADLEHFRKMREEAATGIARAATRIVIGPWSHGMFHNVVGDLDFGLRANGLSLDLREDLTGLQLRWFDRWLKDRNNDADEEAPVRLFVQGANRWRDETGWPLARARVRPLYLRAQDGLSFEAPSAAEAPDGYVYDPQDPTPTCGGSLLMPMTYRCGPVDQAPWLARRDVLCFTSAPLGEGLEVTGPVKAVLFAATSAPDTDWIVRLCDVHADGRTFNVCDGVLRAQFRESLSAPRPVEPGAVLRYEIDLWATSMLFRAGHRLRVLVTSSDFPRYDRNPNTGEFGVNATHTQAARQQIFHDAARASHLVLPVIPTA